MKTPPDIKPLPRLAIARFALRAALALLVTISATPSHAAAAEDEKPKQELLTELEKFHRALLKKMQDDVVSTATILQIQAALDKDRVEFFLLGKEMANAVVETSKATMKVTGTAAKALVTAVIGNSSRLVTAATTAEELDPGIWRQIIHEVLTSKSWGGLKESYDMFGSALVNMETVVEARASLDGVSRNLFVRLQWPAEWGTNPQAIAEHFLATDPTFGVRRTLSTWPRTRGTPFVRLADVVLQVNNTFEQLARAVTAGEIPNDRIPALTALVKTLRTGVAQANSKRQRITYPLGSAPDVNVTVVLGQVTELSRKYTELTQANLKGITTLQKSYTVSMVKDIVGEFVDGVYHHGAAIKQAVAERMTHVNSAMKVGVVTFTDYLMSSSGKKGVEIALDEVADLFKPEADKGDTIIESGFVRAEMERTPVEAMFKLPEEFSSLAMLVADLDGSFTAARRTPAPAPPKTMVPFAIGTNVSNVSATVVIDGASRSVAIPAVVSAPANTKVTITAPAKAGNAPFQFFLLNGKRHSTSSFTFVAGEGDPLLAYDTVTTVVPSGPPAISGPDTIEAGSFAAYSVPGATGVTWDTSDTSMARISADGRLEPIAAIPTEMGFTIFARVASTPNRLEKKIRVTPRKTGLGYKLLRIPVSANFSYDLSPEPARVNDAWSYPTNSVVTVTIKTPPDMIVATLGDPGIPITNPVVLVMDQDRELRPVVQQAAAVKGPRIYHFQKPAGKGAVAFTSPRVTGSLARAESSYQAILDTNERITATLTLAPDEVLLGTIGSSFENGVSRTTMVHDVSVFARIGSAIKTPEADRKRTAEIVLAPNLFEAVTNVGQNDSGKIELSAGPTMTIEYYHGRPGQSDSFTDAYFRLPTYRIQPGFPQKVLRATIVFAKVNKVSDKGSIVLMQPSRSWNPGTTSNLPGGVAYAGAPSANVQGASTVELEITDQLNAWLRGESNLGLLIRSTTDKWNVTLATALHGDRNLRPKLRLEWVEPEPTPVAPILTSRIAPATLGENGTASLSATLVSDSTITYRWTRDGVAIPSVVGASLIASVPGTYRLTATNAVGSTTNEFVVAPKPVPDIENPLVSASSLILVTNAAGVATLTATVKDQSAFTAQIESATASGTTTINGNALEAKITAPLGVSHADLVVVDAANNASKLTVQCVNASKDATAPQVTGTTHALPGSAVTVQYTAFDDVAVNSFEILLDGVVAHSVRLPAPAGAWTSPEGMAPKSVKVRATDFAGRVTTVDAAISRRMPQVLIGLPALPTTEVALPVRIPASVGATSGLPVALTVTGPARVEGFDLVVSGAGDVSVEAVQEGNAFWERAVLKLTTKVSALKEPLVISNGGGSLHGGGTPVGSSTPSQGGNNIGSTVPVMGSGTTTNTVPSGTVVPPRVTQQPSGQTVAAGASASFTVRAGDGVAAIQWQHNGADIPGATNYTHLIASVQPAHVGMYRAILSNSAGSTTSEFATLGVKSSAKLIGPGQEFADIVHPVTHFTYDQILLQGAAITIKADPNQIVRLSFLDIQDDIVQVEFSGAGTLSLFLDAASGPAASVKYNQPGVTYMRGHAGIVVAGANESTNLSVFSVGRANAVNPALFRDGVAYDGFADLAFIAILSDTGKFGGLRTANGSYFATKGLTGIYAPGVHFSGPVFVGDISAYDAATPVLMIGSSPDTRITGGDLLQANGQAVKVAGLTQLKFTAGSTSHAVNNLPARVNHGRLEQDGSDVTTQVAQGGVASSVANPVGSPRDSAVSVSDTAYIGTRISVTSPFTVTSIKVEARSNYTAPMFAAIVRLSSSASFPTASPATGLANPTEVVVSAVFIAGPNPSVISIPVSAALTPGSYAVIFGAGRFGSPGGLVSAGGALGGLNLYNGIAGSDSVGWMAPSERWWAGGIGTYAISLEGFRPQ